MADEGWSNELKAATRRAIDDGRLGYVPMGDQLHMKEYSSSRYGAMALSDLRSGRLRIVDKDTAEALDFTSIDQLLAAGWAVD